MPSCKYYFGKVFAHLAGALVVSAISAETSSIGRDLVPSSSEFVNFITNLAILLGLMFGVFYTQPGGPLKYIFFIAFAFWIGQVIKPLVTKLKDKNVLSRSLILTSGVFAAMTALGFYDSMNLLGLGPYLLAGLVGLILAQAGIFLFGNDAEKRKGLQWLNILGVILFSLFTAYDIQVLRRNAAACKGLKAKNIQPDYPAESLGIYLDFVNLFQNIGLSND